jgi:hypothetical protein
MGQAHKGILLREARTLAIKLGARVEPVNRTGEVVFVHDRMSQRCRVNGRRKDVSKHLVVWLRTLERGGDR